VGEKGARRWREWGELVGLRIFVDVVSKQCDVSGDVRRRCRFQSAHVRILFVQNEVLVMKRLLGSVLLALFLLPTGGCSYGAITVQGDKAVVVKNNSFLFGVFRHAYVCENTENGLANCKDSENP